MKFQRHVDLPVVTLLALGLIVESVSANPALRLGEGASANGAAVGSRASDSSADTLETRSFPVDPEAVAVAIRNFGAEITTAKSSSGNERVLPALRSLFRAAGVDVSHKTLFYDVLLNRVTVVRATSRDLERIDAVLKLISANPPTVALEVRMFQGGPAVNVDGVISTNAVLLTAEGVRTTVKALADLGVTNRMATNVTTESGKQARVMLPALDAQPAPAEIQDFDAGGRRTVALNAPAPSIEVIPYARTNGTGIQLTVLPTVQDFLGYNDPGTSTGDIWATGGPFAPRDRFPISAHSLPKFRLRQIAISGVAIEGQTMMVRVDQKTSTSAKGVPVIYLVTPRLELP